MGNRSRHTQPGGTRNQFAPTSSWPPSNLPPTVVFHSAPSGWSKGHGGVGGARRQGQIPDKRGQLAVPELKQNGQTRVAGICNGARDAYVTTQAALRQRIAAAFGPGHQTRSRRDWSTEDGWN